MTHDLYELAALAARYVFAALMLLIVLRAARLTVLDSRKAAKLRRLSPMTGVCGELVVLEGDGRARRGMKYPVIREGMIGSSGRADVRIRHKSVRRRHAFFLMTDQGLMLRDHANAPMRDADGEPVRKLLLGDGDEFSVGGIRLLLVLSDASIVQRQAEEGLFAAGFDEQAAVWDARPVRESREALRSREAEFREAMHEADALHSAPVRKKPDGGRAYIEEGIAGFGGPARKAAFPGQRHSAQGHRPVRVEDGIVSTRTARPAPRRENEPPEDLFMDDGEDW